MSAIDNKYAELLQSGVLDLGPPQGPEIQFEDQGAKRDYLLGTIYFHPRVGNAFECHGLILDRYRELGENRSPLGYPISDETDASGVAGGRTNAFETGDIVYDPAAGLVETFETMTDAVEVVIKVVDPIELSLGWKTVLTLEEFAGELGIAVGHPLIAAISFGFPVLEFSRLFDGITTYEIADLVALAQQNDPGFVAPVFDNYIVVSSAAAIDAETLVSLFAGWPALIEDAYVQPVASDPQVVGTGNPLFSVQGQLAGFGSGINVQAAWATGADGSGIRFVDVEQGWFFGHEDLPPGIPLLNGVNSAASFAHGCAMLGIIVARDDTRGVVGIAPEALARTISRFEPGQNRTVRRQRLASRILESARSLQWGDVLLLESQLVVRVGNSDEILPAEIDPAIHKAIQTVSRLGIVVVEPAGNSSFNLDNFVDAQGKHPLNSANPLEFKESGAIMVGACTALVPHDPHADTNFGSRIDCWGLGEGVVTTGDPNAPTKVDAYLTNNVPVRTSGASAIVAGVCILVQNLQLLRQPRGPSGKLGTFSMRDILRRAGNGSAVTTSNRPLPDLGKILANEYL